jgi:hypothetical protein
LANVPAVKVQVRTVPRGSWKWQNAYRVQIVICPLGEQPDCRRRGHRKIAVVAAKVGGKNRLAREVAYAERAARQIAREQGMLYSGN